jgi:hypothetical protein
MANKANREVRGDFIAATSSVLRSGGSIEEIEDILSSFQKRIDIWRRIQNKEADDNPQKPH